MMSSILQQISYHTVPRQRMAAIQVFAIFAVCLVFCPILASLNPSSELLSKNYVQIAQHFGFSFPKLGNISFANVSKQCRETVEKLSKTNLAYPCEYLFFQCCSRGHDIFVRQHNVATAFSSS